MKLTTRIAVAAALCLVAPVALAQIQVSYFAKDASPNKALPQPCVEETTTFNQILVKYPHPATWTFIIVCDDRSWDKFMGYSGFIVDGDYIYGSTNRTNHTTFLRGTSLLGRSRDNGVSPDELVAHELAHIFLASGDERRVRLKTSEWLLKTASENH